VLTFSSRLHEIGDNDCVAKETVARARGADDPGYHSSTVKSAAYQQIRLWPMCHLHLHIRTVFCWLTTRLYTSTVRHVDDEHAFCSQPLVC